MTDFMRHYIRLREITGRVEPLPQLLIERQIDVDLLVAGTIKRSNRRTGNATRRTHLVRKQDEVRLAILAPVLTKDVVPNVFRFTKHDAHELFLFFLLRVLRT